METKNNEENGVLRERFALAMERIGEIAGEATVPEAYQPYFRRTAGFILTMEGLSDTADDRSRGYWNHRYGSLSWQNRNQPYPEPYRQPLPQM